MCIQITVSQPENPPQPLTKTCLVFPLRSLTVAMISKAKSPTKALWDSTQRQGVRMSHTRPRSARGIRVLAHDFKPVFQKSKGSDPIRGVHVMVSKCLPKTFAASIAHPRLDISNRSRSRGEAGLKTPHSQNSTRYTTPSCIYIQPNDHIFNSNGNATDQKHPPSPASPSQGW